MTDLQPLAVSPLPRGISHRWVVPGSKSITNRAFVLAALASGTTVLEGVLHSDDTRHMRAALGAMGITIDDVSADAVVVHGGRERLRPPPEPLFIGNSGTSVRFLTALATLVPGLVELTGDEHMGKRPIGDLTDALQQLGITVECPTGCPPLRIHGGHYGGGEVTMPGHRSSQYFSALMLMGGMANQPLRIHVDGQLVSRPYVAMTQRMVSEFGGRVVDEDDGGFTVQPCRAYRPLTYRIEPDASAASYPLALAAATGSTITVPNLGRGSMQGDIAFAEVLEQTGCEVEMTPHSITVRGPNQLRGIDVDMHHISDTVMTLAAIAPLAEGPTTITNIANIRIKETDRLAALVTELGRLGQEVEHGPDWLRIHPRPVSPACVRCYADHRIAMSFAILGCATEGVTIEDPGCVAKTYPGFWQDLEALRTSTSPST